MSLKAQIFLFVSIILLNTKPFAFSICVINLSENAALRPKILLTVGSQQVDLSLHTANNDIKIFEYQKVEVRCNTKFKYPEQYSDESKIELICGDNLDSYSRYNSRTTFECSPQQWNLYESSQNFVWCPKNTSSYLIARSTNSKTFENFQYLAGVCYDIQHLSFKSIYYTISANAFRNSSPALLNKLYEPSLLLKHFKDNLGIKRTFDRNYSQPDIQNWIQFAKYEYSSIIQNPLLLAEYDDQFGSLLDLLWWPSLRLGNWQRYEMALKHHVETNGQSFDIIAGVSDLAAVPIIKSCATNFTWAVLEDNRNDKIPLYIWNYLRSTTNSSEEIVIIGVNSPFYEFYSESDVVFCTDICEEIPWLKKASNTFNYSSLGIIFCCSSKDVKLSKRLDGFPYTDIDTKPENVSEQPWEPIVHLGRVVRA